LLTHGDLRDDTISANNQKSSPVHSYPALKMLYKVFDANSATSYVTTLNSFIYHHFTAIHEQTVKTRALALSISRANRV
jgi:hypothetical protein